MNTHLKTTPFDAIVVGGSYAGLSAALQLARARRRVLVVDAGQRRNRFATHSHGFLGQDGRRAADIASDGKAQLLAYDTVSWVDGHAVDARREGAGFAVTVGTDRHRHFHSRRLVLATGVVDQLPPIEGLAQRWGKSVFHCPYCHGYELGNGRIGVLATGALSNHHAMMLPDWGQVTLFTNGAFEPDEAQAAALTARGVLIETVPVARLVDAATVELQDGRRSDFAGLFTLTRTRMASPLAEQLGCAFDDGPLGPFARTEADKSTTVPGVYVCGDAGRMMGNVASAVADGATAGIAAHQSIIFEGAAG